MKRIALLSGACVASAMIVSASGAQTAFAANPTRIDGGLDPNANDVTSIGFDTGMTMEPAGGGSGDQGLIGSYSKVNGIDTGGGALANMSDGFGNRLTGSGHLNATALALTENPLLDITAAADLADDHAAGADHLSG